MKKIIITIVAFSLCNAAWTMSPKDKDEEALKKAIYNHLQESRKGDCEYKERHVTEDTNIIMKEINLAANPHGLHKKTESNAKL